MNSTTRFVLVAALSAAACKSLNAQTLYKSVDPSGRIVYSDKPPSSGRLEKTIDVQTLPNTAIPPETLKELERLKKEGAARHRQQQAWCCSAPLGAGTVSKPKRTSRNEA